MESGPVRVIDDRIKEQILNYPTVELIRKLFPDVKMHGRTVMCNPLRGERHASLSCFRSRSGYPRWKDHGTGETGDNIDFFRKAYPELDYVEAVDRLSGILFGRSALLVSDLPVPSVRKVHVAAVQKPSALRVISVSELSSPDCALLLPYCRGRGISDEVSFRYCRGVVFENENLVGKPLYDETSGLPIYDDSGNPVMRDARSLSVSMPNDVGGWTFRVPATDSSPGFKGCDYSFITTVLSGGMFVPRTVIPVGQGNGYVDRFYYDSKSCVLLYNRNQGFSGVNPRTASLVRPFLETWMERWMEGRDYAGFLSVLNALNALCSDRVCIVEGLFDGLSLIEMDRRPGALSGPGFDLVILNSVSNISWAVPFLSAHSRVEMYLDNDLRSAAGRKAASFLESEVAAYSSASGLHPVCVDCSGLFAPYKDVNDYLRASRGFTVSPPREAAGKRHTNGSLVSGVTM